MAKTYLTNKSLLNELIKSNQQGDLTPEAIKMFQLLSFNTTKMFHYKDEDDRMDAAADALMIILRRWKSFDCSRNNPFAYFTEMCKKNHMIYFNKHIRPSINHLDINNMFNL